MKIASIFFFLCFESILCMHHSDVLAPSSVGKMYSALFKSHLVGRALSEQDVKKAKKIVDSNKLDQWKVEIKPFEVDLLFNLGIILWNVGYIDSAVDMIHDSFDKGNTDNVVIQTVIETYHSVTPENIKTILNKFSI